MANILFVGRDEPDAPNVRHILLHDSYVITHVKALDFDTAWQLSTDLVIFDCAASPYAPPETCRQLRAIRSFHAIPILVLVDVCNAEQVGEILDAGCDDCICGTIREPELAARVRALLRRRTHTQRPALILDAQIKTVAIDGKPVGLTPTEYTLLEVLCKNPGRHFTTSSLLQAVWNYPPGTGDPALVRNHVRNLRRKLENDPRRPQILRCLQGRGYMIGVDVYLT